MKEIPLTQNQVAIVDDEDYDWLSQFKWHAKKARSNSDEYYAALSVGQRGHQHTVFMHRVIMRCPADKVVNHRNTNKLDNRKQNLQVCDPNENHRYPRKKYKKNLALQRCQGNYKAAFRAEKGYNDETLEL